MGRKKTFTSGMDVARKSSTLLAQRLNELITDSSELKDFLGCSLQAVNQYKLGTSRPSLENLVKIADFYGVSTDYLLGRTDVRSVDMTMRAIAEYTGLSESILLWLHQKDSEIIEIIEQLLQNDYFTMALPAISLLRKTAKDVTLPIDWTPEKSDDFYDVECRALDLQHHLISNGAFNDWQRYRIARLIESAIEEMVPICASNSASEMDNNIVDNNKNAHDLRH